jgi:hypothetical protein
MVFEPSDEAFSRYFILISHPVVLPDQLISDLALRLSVTSETPGDQPRTSAHGRDRLTLLLSGHTVTDGVPFQQLSHIVMVTEGLRC